MNFKKLAAKFFLVCFLISTTQYAYSQSMLEQLKDLHLKKKQGWLTDQQFEDKKKAIIESHSPAAKKKAAEEAKILAEKQKQAKILEEQKKREAKALALKEYAKKFPLHSAIKNNNRKKIEELLKLPDLQINEFDDEENTPWDIAYNITNTTVSFELCKLLKEAGAVSSKEIKEFELQKRREKLVTLKVSAGVTYQMGGYQPFVGFPLALVDISAQTSIMNKVNNCLRIYNDMSLITFDGSGVWPVAYKNLQTPIESFVSNDSIIKICDTNTSGQAVFEDIEPGSYLVVFGAPTRKYFALWVTEVSCKEKLTNLTLSDLNAIYAE
jgi:hypothetical protein